MELIPPNVSQRWIRAQRIALGCALLRFEDWSADEDEESGQHIVFKQLWATPQVPDGNEGLAYQVLLQSLPPTTLEALCALPADTLLWAHHAPLWHEAKRQQQTPGRRGISPISAARVVADRLINSSLSPTQILRLVRLELGGNWPPEAETSLGVLMEQLRADRRRVEAITDCGKTMPPGHWALVENDLLQREFAWPLVVGKRADGELVECALPVQLDVIFDAPEMDDVSMSGDPGVIDCTGWLEPARLALSAAKKLWEYKHTSWDAGFSEKIKSAKLVLDLRVAEQIVDAYQSWFRFRLTDDSLGAYLATIIFSRFFDHGAIDTVCATGALGKEEPDPTHRGGDYRIRPVGGIDQKIAYAENAWFFDQIIIPGGQNDATIFRPRLRVSRGEKLSHYVEHAVGQVWRKHRYVRAPDLATAFKRYRKNWRGEYRDSAPEEADACQISEVGELLAQSKQPILALPDYITPANVASALYDVSSRATKGGRNNSNLAHFTFVRAVDGEGHERFWQTVWEALEGGRGDFESASLFAPAEEVGKLIAGRLNWFRPTRKRPCRAPDVLVIIGHNRLPPVLGIASGPASRLHLDQLTPTLNAYLNQTDNVAVRKEIGRTRILLVHEQEVASRGLSDVLKDIHSYESLQRLSTFRHGFTWEMARRMLSLEDDDFARVIREFLEVQIDDEPVVVEASAAVEFYVHRRVPPPKRAADLAELHYRAANAIVGFLEPNPQGHRLDVSLGLSARWRHEAQWHLDQAMRLRSATPNTYKSALERLNRIAEPLSWSRLRWAVQQSTEEGLDTWDALKVQIGKARWPFHPLDLVWAAKFADNLRKNHPGRASELNHCRDIYLRDAMTNCLQVPAGEVDACRFVVATTWASLVMKDVPSLDGWSAASHPNLVAKTWMESASEIYDPEWFECLGDKEGDYPNIDVWGRDGAARKEERDRLSKKAAAVAVPLYRAGFWNDRIRGAHGCRIQTVVKWLGALAEADLPLPDEERQRIVALPPATRKWFMAKRDAARSGLNIPSVQRRWARGRDELEGLWGVTAK